MVGRLIDERFCVARIAASIVDFPCRGGLSVTVSPRRAIGVRCSEMARDVMSLPYSGSCCSAAAASVDLSLFSGHFWKHVQALVLNLSLNFENNVSILLGI